METPGSQRMERAAGERRRCVRQRIHTPAYATLDESSSGVELSEILDISEEGVAIQTSTPPALDQDIDLCLDLSETKTRIRASGRVVRVEGGGRAAIRFPEMPEAAKQQLREWLFLNAVMAGVNQGALDQDVLIDSDDTPSDFTSRLIGLAAVDREVAARGSDLDAAVDLIAERALTFTSASGAAIALSQGSELVCVASSGSMAPPLESRLQVGSGFSGECVRTGKLMYCHDSEEDSRVDQESCRALGIRSMMAAPIRQNGQVIGLLEVFSPRAGGLDPDAETVLRHLAETTGKVISRAGSPAAQGSEQVALSGTYDENPSEGRSWLASQRTMLIGSALVFLVAAMILVATPWKKHPAQPAAQTPAPAQANVTPPSPAVRRQPSATGVADVGSLRALAEEGDPSAEFAVGARYATGQEVQQDYAEAIRWFTRAAEQGHVVSQATLGAYYWAGRGVPPDLEKAYYWSILAQNGGDQASKYRVAVLTSRLTHTQVAAAQQQANDWIRQHRGVSQAVAREQLPQ